MCRVKILKIRFLYYKEDKSKVKYFKRKLLECDKKLEFLDADSDDIEDITIIVANDEYKLKKIISEFNVKGKFAILTFSIKTEYIFECLNYTNVICYGKGTPLVILEKLKRLL